MAIDRIPGVGPQNSDIATAVAAPSAATIASTIATTPAVSAQITANVPTAAAIASAVAAPSSATIQNLIQTYAAPASVTMAAITSSITTNAASAGVTNASIATQVANNAPSANAWTLIGSTTWSSGAVTFSSLSGYKSYRMIVPYSFVATGQGGAQTGIRINGDSTSSYMVQAVIQKPSSVTSYAVTPNQAMYTGPDSLSNGTTGYTQGIIEIYNANIAGPKYAAWDLVLRTADGVTISRGSGMYNTTNTITSITYLIANGATMNTSSMNVYLYGAN
jgi:hypothetical protein